jgi:hypothetical protein
MSAKKNSFTITVEGTTGKCATGEVRRSDGGAATRPRGLPLAQAVPGLQAAPQREHPLVVPRREDPDAIEPE